MVAECIHTSVPTLQLEGKKVLLKNSWAKIRTGDQL